MQNNNSNFSILIPISEAATRFVSVYGSNSSNVVIKKLSAKKVDISSKSEQQLLWILDQMNQLGASKSAYLLKNFSEERASLAALCGGVVFGFKLASSHDSLILKFFKLHCILAQVHNFQFDYFDWMGSFLSEINEGKIFEVRDELTKFESDTFFYDDLLVSSKEKIATEFFSKFRIRLTAEN